MACFYHKSNDLVARLYGVQEAVSSTLATRTKDGCQGQQERQIRKDLAFFCFFTASNAAAPALSRWQWIACGVCPDGRRCSRSS